MENNEKRIAVFIDADNTQYDKLGLIFEKITTFGRIQIKRAYGNWTKQCLAPWRNCSNEFAINQIQQTDYVSGKNSSDISLIIDAMDFAFSSDCDVFTIVSSDSDFTPLAIKLRELGKRIIGVGRKNTIDAFVNACDDFFYIEDFVQDRDSREKRPVQEDSPDLKRIEKTLVRLLHNAAEKYQDDEGFTNISSAGTYVKRVMPQFDVEVLGFSKLPQYIASRSNLFECRKRPVNGTTIFEFRFR